MGELYWVIHTYSTHLTINPIKGNQIEKNFVISSFYNRTIIKGSVARNLITTFTRLNLANR